MDGIPDGFDEVSGSITT